MTLDELNKIDARLHFTISRMVDGPAGPQPRYRAVVPFGDGATLSVVTDEDEAAGGYAAGVRFDVGFIIDRGLAEITWYQPAELPRLLDALKIDGAAHNRK